VSRGENYFDIFRGGVPPVETVLGESYGLGRRTASSTVFARARYRLDSTRGSYGFRIACPDSGSGLVLRQSHFKRISLRVFFHFAGERIPLC
jgi:hypothetical protein